MGQKRSDRNFRVTLYPPDASPVKEFSFSRRLGLVCLSAVLPLSVMGFWLTCTGTLHEPEDHSRYRRELAAENRTLGHRVSTLDRELQSLRRELDQLEAQKSQALLISGLG